MSIFIKDPYIFQSPTRFNKIVVNGVLGTDGSIELNGSTITSWPSGAGGVVTWGDITGYISDNATLQSALDAKYNGLPTQTGNAGKFLTTNGTIESWDTISAGDINVDSIVHNNSGNWDSVYLTVQNNSASLWNYQGTDIKSLTSNWENVYLLVNITSGIWMGTYTTVNSNSANWTTGYNNTLILSTYYINNTLNVNYLSAAIDDNTTDILTISTNVNNLLLSSTEWNALDLTVLVPYTGATSGVDLGNNWLTTNNRLRASGFYTHSGATEGAGFEYYSDERAQFKSIHPNTTQVGIALGAGWSAGTDPFGGPPGGLIAMEDSAGPSQGRILAILNEAGGPICLMPANTAGSTDTDNLKSYYGGVDIDGIFRLKSQTTNGFVKYLNGDGTFGVDTNDYQLSGTYLSGSYDVQNTLNINYLSSNIDNVYNTVNTNSASLWNYQGTDIKALTSNWENTYITVSTLSSTWVGGGGSWGSITGTLSTQTDLWDNLVTLSGRDNLSVDTIVTTNSSNWQDVYTTVGSNSGSWGGSSTTGFAHISGEVFTGNISISANTPTFTLISKDDSNNTATLSRNVTNRALTLKNYVGSPAVSPQSIYNTGTTTAPINAPSGAFPTSTGTVSYWFYKTGNPSSTITLFTKGDASTYVQTGLSTSGILTFSGTQTGTPNWSIASSALGNNVWINVTARWTTNSAELWINGSIIGSKDTVNSVNPTGTTYLYIANFIYGSGGTCYIDEYATWNRYLTDGEVGDIYNSGSSLYLVAANNFSSSGTPISTNLLGLYHFDGVLTDSSGNGYTATSSFTSYSGSIYKTVAPASTVEAQLIYSIDGLLAGEKGINTFGEIAGRTVIDGTTIRLNLGGVEKGQLNSTSLSQTLPHIITGSSDAIQLKVVANATQTNNLIEILASDGTTKLIYSNGAGVLLPLQKPTASAPTHIKGGIYFDTTLNKLRVGGLSAWETITSV